ncbi:MAG: SulP family inorganic anion transporter [Mycobacteriaceae bacterium]|nr:SulP family inorganic anion transporter [Mycobacteriaceae bacterium]
MNTAPPRPPTATTADRLGYLQRCWATLRFDLPASAVVFLVALPLSLGIAVASGAPVTAGLLAAVVGGIVAGLFGGSNLQVSGPAAGLTMVVAELVHELGWPTTCLITMGAGLLQILFGITRIARAALAIAPVVVHAMLAGIGITIVLQQTHVALGDGPASRAWTNLTQLPQQLAHPAGADLLVGVVVIAVLLTWKYAPAPIQRVPAPLIAVIAGTLVSLPLPVNRITLSASIIDAVHLPALPHGHWAAVATGILTMALIASVESLLSAVAVDKMHRGPRADFDRELIGQGAANAVSGLIGGLPITGVIVRSATNARAGARTRTSAVLHGIWILLAAVAAPALITRIPTAALAGLLIVVGIQLVQVSHITLAHRTGDLLVYAATMTGVVFLNLLEGVLIGLALAATLLLARIVELRVHSEPHHTDANAWQVTVTGSATFLALPRLTAAFAAIPDGADVTVDLHLDFLDHAAYDAITQWTRQHQQSNGHVHIHEHGTIHMATAPHQPPTKRTLVPTR